MINRSFCPQELLEVNNQFSARLQKGLEESVAKGDEVTLETTEIQSDNRCNLSFVHCPKLILHHGFANLLKQPVKQSGSIKTFNQLYIK